MVTKNLLQQNWRVPNIDIINILEVTTTSAIVKIGTTTDLGLY